MIFEGGMRMGKITIMMQDNPKVVEMFTKWKGTRFTGVGRLRNMKGFQTSSGRTVIAWQFDQCWPLARFAARRVTGNKVIVMKGW